METGIRPEQIERLKDALRRCTGDPVRYRLFVAVVIAVVGYYGVMRPLMSRVDAARRTLARAEAEARSAKAVLSMQAQTKLYEPRLTEGRDASAFEQYVIAVARRVGLHVYSLATRRLTPMGPYHAAALVLEAEGDFAEILDFVDRIERGERIARLDNLRFNRKGDTMGFTCSVLGLQRRSDAPAPRPQAAAPGKEGAGG